MNLRKSFSKPFNLESWSLTSTSSPKSGGNQYFERRRLRHPVSVGCVAASRNFCLFQFFFLNKTISRHVKIEVTRILEKFHVVFNFRTVFLFWFVVSRGGSKWMVFFLSFECFIYLFVRFFVFFFFWTRRAMPKTRKMKFSAFYVQDLSRLFAIYNPYY